MAKYHIAEWKYSGRIIHKACNIYTKILTKCILYTHTLTHMDLNLILCFRTTL